MTRSRTRCRTIRATGPADLLAMVPYLLGFHPDHSVVLVTLGRPPTPVHARQDLPDHLDDVPDLVADLVAVTRRAGVARAAVIAYTDDDVLAAAVSRPLVAGLADAGVEVPVVLRADGERWFCLGDASGGCSRACPPEGTPYDLATHPLTTEALVEGRVVLASRDALRDSLRSDDAEAQATVGAAMEVAGERLLAAARSPLGPPDPGAGRAHLVAEGRWVQHRIRRFVRDRARLDAHDAGRLLVALAAVEVRDVAWAQVGHHDAAMHVDLWRDVVRRSPREARAAPAALLAFAAWLSGDGALASCALDLCQDAEPGYSMAGLLSTVLASGLPPDTWRPMPPEALTLFRV